MLDLFGQSHSLSYVALSTFCSISLAALYAVAAANYISERKKFAASIAVVAVICALCSVNLFGLLLVIVFPAVISLVD